MKSFQLGIQGTTALLMNHPGASVEWGRRASKGRLTPAEQAEAVACRLPDGQLYLPAEALFRAAIEAAGTIMLKRVVAAGLMFRDAALPFTPRIEAYQLDERSVVLPNTGMRAMRYRPRLDEWAIETTVDVDDVILEPDSCRRIVEVAGRQKGVGDYRPGRGGPYGRFVVMEWTLLTAPATARQHAVC